jgi:nucleobase:cation symporter-1, NCS1 family
MLIDFFVIRKGNLNLTDMFSLSPHGRYHYFHGFNLRAFAAFVIGFLLPLPGFAQSFGTGGTAAAAHMYSLGWVLSFLVGCLSYYVICVMWKVPGDDGSHPFESAVEPAQQIIFDGVLLGEERHHVDEDVEFGASKELQITEKAA